MHAAPASALAILTAAALLALGAGAVRAGSAICPAVVPVQGGGVRGAQPLLPADNWWNLDIRTAPVDPGSDAYLAFIQRNGPRRLHPDFGGEEAPGSVGIYGFPYAVVGAGQLKLPVSFVYRDESDGVDSATGLPQPFYPIPSEAITQPHWVEGGAPAAVDQRDAGDRHLLVVDCAANRLYELYNVAYDAASGRWLAGSGAFFDLGSNARRPDGWTSADAAGLAIFPGLVRYDEVYDDAVAELGHALRVTVRATNGYVWPASHRAGNTAGALPMGARLRLKTSVDGADPALRTSDPGVRKIFRALQKHGLIVADNGSDFYISGTFDTRWNNDILNPAFALLSGNDFEVVQLGWNPATTAPGLASLALAVPGVPGGAPVQATLSLDAAAPAGGVTIDLVSSNTGLAQVPPRVIVVEGQRTAGFTVTTRHTRRTRFVVLTAHAGGRTASATLAVTR